ncbi:hypothetical protein [Hyalangium sp.]|uniref:hypothetical protein n=1 Tax=Hyalangium sp. TaxID=2028555 RepID=UPI002D4AD831|nr:hypothetical protein [Hyalangium sp.]HYH99726.1 hypothetical protein [Hyalangium sp.]
MKITRYLSVIAGLVALAFIVAALDSPEDSAPVTEAPVKVALTPPAPARDTTSARPALPPPPALLAAPEEVPGEEGEHGEFTTATDLMKAKIFKTEPELARFDYFREHVLLDSNGRKDYEALLADTQVYEQLRRTLGSSTEAEESLDSSIKRLMRIDYLREALAWRQNPAREQLVSTVEAILLERSFSPELSLNARRSMAATRMELYEIFADHEPERASALVEAAKGTSLEKLLQYLAAHNQRRLVKEQALSLQAQARP